MKKNTKLMVLSIGQIKIDDAVYPRTKYDWFTANNYKNSMLSGAVFPPIEVAYYKKRYLLIDGRHRLEAYKLVKEQNIQCNVYYNLDLKTIFTMAIKANVGHGRPLSPQDKGMIIDKLEKMDFFAEEISRLVNVPLDKLEQFKFNKITNTISGEAVYLKAVTKNYAGQEVPENFEEMQTHFSTRGQEHLLRQVVKLLENGLLDLDEEGVARQFIKLQALVKAVKIPLKINH